MTTLAEMLSPDQLDALRELADDDTVDPEKMTDQELVEEIAARTERIDEICQEIEENDAARRRMEPDYRRGLYAERNTLKDERSALYRVHNKRGTPTNPPGKKAAAKVAQDRLEATIRQEQALREARVARMQAMEVERNRDRFRLYVKAAFRVLPEDQARAIWDKAKEFWPDSPAWLDVPKPDEIVL